MKHINFKSITIQNFLSIGREPVIIRFEKGLHVITGKNMDKADRRNGVGKSTVAEAIYFACFGDTLRSINKNLIPNNVTGGSPIIELEFEVVTPTQTLDCKVVRGLSPSKVLYFENGEDKTLDTISNTNKYICNIISATPAIFKNCVIMTISDTVPFMAKSKTEKRKFIEDIFGLEVFSVMISNIRAEYNDIKRLYDMQQISLNEASQSLETYTTHRDNILKDRKQKHDKYKLREKENKIARNKLLVETQSLSSIEYIDIEDKLSRLRVGLDNCDDRISILVGEAATDKASVKELTRQMSQIIDSNINTCSMCLRELNSSDINQIENEKIKLKSKIKDLKVNITDIVSNINTLKTKKIQINSGINKLQELTSQQKLNKQNIRNNNEKIEQLSAWLDDLKVDLTTTKSTTTKLDDVIKSSLKIVNDLKVKTSDIRSQLSTLDIVKYVVSEEGVKSYIVSKLLNVLNSRLIHYLKVLDSNSICTFNEYFEEEVLNEKGKICSYFNFSGAERKAIDLACLFTFSDLRRIHGDVQYNIAIYDELFDSSFDEKGIELVVDTLLDRIDALDECTLLISHRKETIKCATGDIIYLEKNNGVTMRKDYLEIS